MRFNNRQREIIKAILFLGYLVTGISLLLIAFGNASCKKAVQIDQPVNSITTEGTFSSVATATSGVIAIYSKLINTNRSNMFGSGGMSLFLGLSSDELNKVGLSSGSTGLSQLFFNDLTSDNSTLQGQIWGPAYFAIYQANSCIEGLQNSKDLNSDQKNQLIGECKFLRAFAYFYLTNLWGDIPMPLTSDWNNTYSVAQTSKADVFQQVINDLKYAEQILPGDYSSSNNERIRANKFSATALLSRVYLYQKDWVDAESEATSVINSNLFNLNSDLTKVFLKNSTEAILQFQPSNGSFPYAVPEQYQITLDPIYYLSDNLLNAFDSTDSRKSAWTKSKVVSGATYYYPYKYKIAQGTANGTVSEYYMVLRLAEQYLIRAEARAQQNKISDALSDLNQIRNRAKLPSATANDKTSLLTAIEHERQYELFSEWGHRWFDLIRTDRANVVLTAIKGSRWQNTDQLFPIPLQEISRNSHLSQNAGY